MAYEHNNSYHETYRPHNPWEKFIQKDETKHYTEDRTRLCSPLSTTPEVIEQVLNYDCSRLDRPIPRRRQLLRDFLNEAISRSPRGFGRSVDADIVDSSSDEDIALLDDRQRHERCAKPLGQQCNDCKIFSTNLTIPQLHRRLKEERRVHSAEKRIIFIPNLTSAAALAMASTSGRRSAAPIRNFLHRYLGREHTFSVSTSWGFFLEFHMPYHAMRPGPPSKDHRYICGKRLRKSDPLPLQLESGDPEELYYHEAQTSSLSWGPDEWFWTELFLVDTYFGSEDNLLTYLTGSPSGDGFDPPLGGRGRMTEPCFDPREYWLMKLDRRVLQVTEEYTALIGTFNKRIEAYSRKIRRKFEDDSKRTHTQTLSNVIETIQIFADTISGIVDSWELFHRNQLTFFTIHARDKLGYPGRLDNIIRNIAELDRLRKLLITKRDRFRNKLDSFHTVSSLRQAETAIENSDNMRTLSEMTVYVAMPVMFAAAVFGMDFVKPGKYPWLQFFAVLLPSFLVTYMIASRKSPRAIWIDCRNWIDANLGGSAYRTYRRP